MFKEEKNMFRRGGGQGWVQSGSDGPRWSSSKGSHVEEETTGDGRAKSVGCNRKSVMSLARARQ